MGPATQPPGRKYWDWPSEEKKKKKKKEGRSCPVGLKNCGRHNTKVGGVCQAGRLASCINCPTASRKSYITGSHSIIPNQVLATWRLRFRHDDALPFRLQGFSKPSACGNWKPLNRKKGKKKQSAFQPHPVRTMYYYSS